MRRTKDLHIRVTEAQLALVDQYARAGNLDRSDWVRQQLLKWIGWNADSGEGVLPGNATPEKIGQ